MANLLEIKDKVQRYLAADVKGLLIDNDGDFSFRLDSARVFVRVSEWFDEHIVVTIFSWVLNGLTVTSELKDYVALEGGDFMMGGMVLRVMDDGTANLMFSYSLLGDFLDKDELSIAWRAVASSAERKDDELKARFGGERFHED